MPRDFELVLRHTACFGSCPVFELNLGARGALEYVGHAYTAKRGEAVGFVPPHRVAAIVREVERMHLDQLAASSPGDCMVVKEEGHVMVELTRDGRTFETSSAELCDPNRASRLFVLSEHVLDLSGARVWVDPLPNCRWRVDPVAAAAVSTSDRSVPVAADGIASSVAAAYDDQRGEGLRVVSERRPGEPRRDARRRARRMVARLHAAGVPEGAVRVSVVNSATPARRPGSIVIDLVSAACRPG